MPKKMTELEKRRQRTQEFLNELGVKMPIVKFSTPTKEADLINNKNFTKATAEILFNRIDDELKYDDVISVKEMKLHSVVFKQSYKKKFMYDKWIKTKLSAILSSIYPEVIDTLQDTIVVDFIEDDEDKWLDVDYPLYMACEKKYLESSNLRFTDIEIYTLEMSAIDFIDYVTLLVCKYIFKFTRFLDNSSQEQILGNIGGLEDIRKAVKVTFMGKLLSLDNEIDWYKMFLNHYEVCILLGKDEFEKGVSKLDEMPRNRTRKEKVTK